MASKTDAEKVRLECPLCLDNFKDATILNCGHTFCKECLGVYDEQQNDHLVCPVCRQSTKLGSDRVSGLTPNFAVKAVEDKINVDNVDVGDQKGSYCSIHNKIPKDIFCVDCRILICPSCYFDKHTDHKYMKKEELKRNLREQSDFLLKKSKTTKTQIQKCLADATQEDEDIHRHLNNLDKDIKDKFAKKFLILQKHKKLLLKRVDDIRKDSKEQSNRYMTHYRQLLDNIKSSMTQLTDSVIESSDPNNLQAYHLQCREIENLLHQTIDIKPMVHLKQTAKSTRFCPGDEKLLALGHIEQGGKSTASIMQDVKTAIGVRQNIEEARSKITEIRASVTRNSEIVRKVELPSSIMKGMAALSQDAVVVGDAGINGADCVNVSGDIKPHLRSEVGRVCDIALLTDGRSGVSHRNGTILVYDRQCNQIRGMTYTCPDCTHYPQLCSDQHDNIYAVTGTSHVFIFHGNNIQPKRVVPTGDIKPLQICVTKTCVMITSTCYIRPSTVTVFDREGHVGTSITARDDRERLCAAVDSQDRVLIARVRHWSDTIGLARYTLQGLTLTKEVTFKPLILREPVQHFYKVIRSYMVSLAPNMIAFADSKRLYFIQIDA